MPIFDKIEKEIGESRKALVKENLDAVKDEFSGMIFALINLVRYLHLDSETAFSGTNDKLRKRFHYVKKAINEEDGSPEAVALDAIEVLYQMVKTEK